MNHPGPIEVLKYEGVGVERKLIYRGWEDGDEKRVCADTELFERMRKIPEDIRIKDDFDEIVNIILQELSCGVEQDVKEAFGDVDLEDLGSFISDGPNTLKRVEGMATEIIVDHRTKETFARACKRVKPKVIKSDPITSIR